MVRGTLTILAAAVSIFVGLVATTDAKPPPACKGRFVISGPLQLGGLSIDAITIGSDKKVSTGACGIAKKKVKAKKTGTKVNVLWPRCQSLKKVVLKGSLGTDCGAFSGTIKAKRVAPIAVNARVSTGCGDGVLDPGMGEACEGTTGCSPSEQCSNCHCNPIPTTTTSTIAPSTSTSGPSTTATTSTSTSTTTSTTIPAPPNCGDGNVQTDQGEECDDGNTVADDGCTDHCTICGNSVITPPETCDDGNHVSGDGCSAVCRAAVCGDGFVDPPETCDDHNTTNFDDCPSSCIEEACTADPTTMPTATVSWNAPSSVGGLIVVVDYPEGKVFLPGTGGLLPPGTLTGFPSGTSNQPSKLGTLGYALRELVSKPVAITPRPGTLFQMHFQGCQGATPPAAGDFTCTVQAATAPDGLTPVSGATCSVALP